MSKHSIAQIKAWALENYDTNFGASCIIECFTDAEIAYSFKDLADAQSFAQVQSEQLGTLISSTYPTTFE